MTWLGLGWGWRRDLTGLTRTRWRGWRVWARRWWRFRRTTGRRLRPRTSRHLTAAGDRASVLAIVKADWRYGSVVIGPDGQVVAGTSLDRAEKMLLVADVRLASPGTLYTATGDWLGVASLGALAAMLAGTAVLAVRGRRVSGDRQERRTRPS